MWTSELVSLFGRLKPYLDAGNFTLRPFSKSPHTGDANPDQAKQPPIKSKNALRLKG
jgi:hypothetical protein